MSESIQKVSDGRVGLADDAVRAAFIARAAELYDRPPAVDPTKLEGLADVAALLLAFPWMHDPELLEALWALGQYRDGGDV